MSRPEPAKPNLWIFPIEPIDSRYTQQWYDHIPELLEYELGHIFQVRNVDGDEYKAGTVTPGAFLDFVGTNYYKSSQLANFLKREHLFTPNDSFLITDAWNPCILQLRYTSDLMGYNWKLHGIFHAGSYDPSDILGYTLRQPWPRHLERSLYYALDRSYFASNFHKNMFLRNLEIPSFDVNRAIRSGQPHGELLKRCNQFQSVKKTDSVIWPHRYNPDKQPAIMEDLATKLTANVIITQKLQLSKLEYYQIMAQSKVLFSCSLHENLGIGVAEGVFLGVIPIVPDRASYSEIYLPEFKYPSEWTESFETYIAHQKELLAMIEDRIANYSYYEEALSEQKIILARDYFSATAMLDQIAADS